MQWRRVDKRKEFLDLEDRKKKNRWTRLRNQATRMYVKSVFIVHVGCTRCVTSRTANIMKILVRITLMLNVYEHVFSYFDLMWKYKDEYDQY